MRTSSLETLEWDFRGVVWGVGLEKGAPEKPCSCVRPRAVLLPSSEMITSYADDQTGCVLDVEDRRTGETFPASPPYRKVVLAGKVLLDLPAIAIAEIGRVPVAVVKAQTLF